MRGTEKTDIRREVWARMAFVIGILVFGFLGVIGRVYYLQTVKADKLEAEADRQTSSTVELQASRGTILDRNGVEMAVTTKAPSIFVHPRQIENPEAAAEQLDPHLELSRDELVERLGADRDFLYLERQATPETWEAIRKLELPGVGREIEHKRYYPLGDVAGQLLGFVGVDDKGLDGIERMLHDQLAGGTHRVAGTRDARGRTIFSNGKPDLEKLQGNSVQLTIDERIQKVAQEALSEQVEKYDAAAGHAVVLEVETGEVLAIANTPSFNPNRFGEYKPKDWRLRPVTDVFEPGSVFKPLVLAAAIEEGTVSLGSAFDCEDGYIRIGKHAIRDSHPHEVLTAAEIIQKSSNIGAYKIAETIGKQKLYEYIRGFGYGERTGLGIQGEQPGLVWPPDRWAEVTFANVAFGQGLSATPLQVTRSIAAIANDGLLLRPRIIKAIHGPEGDVLRRTTPELDHRVVSKSTAEKVSRAMSLVTLEEGTGTNAAMKRYTVAGKTGTAQKVNPETRRYDPDLWVGSFVGFVPAERPEIAIAVMIDEPTDTHYGGVVAAPAFKKIAAKALAVRGVVPVPDEERFDLTRDQKNEARWGGEKSAGVEGGESEKNEKSEGRSAETATKGADGGDPAARRVAAGSGVPDLRGLTLREALSKAREAGYTPRIDGWGRVVSQTPRPGRRLEGGEDFDLVLAPRGTGTPSPKGPAEGSRR